MSVKERLVDYIKFKKMTNRGFSLSIGMSENYVASMRKSIQPSVIQKITEKYPDLNTGWLLTGEGEMLKNKEETKIDSRDESEIIELKVQLKMLKELVAEKDQKIEQLNKEVGRLEERVLLLQRQHAK